jgi:hypothetical protein
VNEAIGSSSMSIYLYKINKGVVLSALFWTCWVSNGEGLQNSAKRPQVKFECVRFRCCETPRKLSGEQTRKLTVPCVFSVYAWLGSCYLQSE